MGLMSTIVIMIHELPHEIGDFAHLIKYGYPISKILWTQFLTSLGALIGGFAGNKYLYKIKKNLNYFFMNSYCWRSNILARIIGYNCRGILIYVFDSSDARNLRRFTQN